MLSRRTDLKSSASTALHEGTASRLVIPLRFLQIYLIYYVSRAYKINAQLPNELFLAENSFIRFKYKNTKVPVASFLAASIILFRSTLEMPVDSCQYLLQEFLQQNSYFVDFGLNFCKSYPITNINIAYMLFLKFHNSL